MDGWYNHDKTREGMKKKKRRKKRRSKSTCLVAMVRTLTYSLTCPQTRRKGGWTSHSTIHLGPCNVASRGVTTEGKEIVR